MFPFSLSRKEKPNRKKKRFAALGCHFLSAAHLHCGQVPSVKAY
jgi:hypothetical protein